MNNKKLAKIFLKNLKKGIQSVVIFLLLALFCQLVGIKMGSESETVWFSIWGYGMCYLNIYLGSTLPELIDLQDNVIVKKLAIALQVLAPFLGLSFAAEKGYSATPFFSLLFIAVVVIIRWHKIQKSVFELLGVGVQ